MEKQESEFSIFHGKIINFFVFLFASYTVENAFPNLSTFTKPLGIEFPNDNSNILHVNRIDFSSAVDRVSTIADEKSPVIKFKLFKNLLNMTTASNENGTATEDIVTKYEGSEIEIGFNSKYILEMINNLEDDEIVLTFKDNSSPITATEKSNPDLIYVLMPMRV